MTELYTNDTWRLYFHDPYDVNWAMESYHPVGNMGTVQEYWQMWGPLKEKIQCGMFFFMREHIFPRWDDPCNIEGGCISIKILKQDMKAYWENLCTRLIGETIFIEGQRQLRWKRVNGISTSPKKSFCIIKIWLDCSEQDLGNDYDKLFDIPRKYHGEMLFRLNKESIDKSET